MLRLLQAVRPNPSYAPGGVDNFWKVEDDAGNVAGPERNNNASSREAWRQDTLREPRKEIMDEEASAKVSPLEKDKVNTARTKFPDGIS